MAKKAVDLMSECLIEMVRDYKAILRKRDLEISEKTCDIAELNHNLHEEQNKREAAVKQCNRLNDTLDEVSKIIASFTDYEDGTITIFANARTASSEKVISRLFSLLDIPMTVDQIKDGDTDED